MGFTARLGKGEDGFLVARCEGLSRCMAQAKTLEEVEQNVAEALELCLGDALLEEPATRMDDVAPLERIRFELVPA